MERIRLAFIKHSPEGTEFVRAPSVDAVHAVQWIGQNPKQHTKLCERCMAAPTLPKGRKYILIVHLDNPHYPQHEDHFKKLLEDAMLIITYHGDFIKYDNCNVFETPWGVDPSVFHVTNTPKLFTVLTTGYDAKQEAIDAMQQACYISKCSMVHVGGDCDLPWKEPTSRRFQDVSDPTLRELYNKSRFVSGLRREGGFELPIIEGYACGCQPITFDNSCHRKFFGDFALFVDNVPNEELIPQLINHFENSEAAHKPVTPDPQILARFQWEKIIKEAWSRLG